MQNVNLSLLLQGGKHALKTDSGHHEADGSDIFEIGDVDTVPQTETPKDDAENEVALQAMMPLSFIDRFLKELPKTDGEQATISDNLTLSTLPGLSLTTKEETLDTALTDAQNFDGLPQHEILKGIPERHESQLVPLVDKTRRTNQIIVEELPGGSPTVLTSDEVSLLEENIAKINFTDTASGVQTKRPDQKVMPLAAEVPLNTNDPTDVTEGNSLNVSVTEVGEVSDLMESSEDNMDGSGQDSSSKNEATQTTAPLLNPKSVKLDTSNGTKVEEGAKGAIQQLQSAVLDLSSDVKANGGSKVLTVALNPGELGEVHVEVTSQHDGTISAKLIVEKAQTFELLHQDINQLKTVLNDIGIETSDISLSVNVDTQDSHEDSQPKYVPWDEQEVLLVRELPKHVTESRAEVLDKPAYYLKRGSHNHLNIET